MSIKAVVYKEPYTVAVEEVPDPRIEDPTDVVIQVTTSAICGSDLHMYEGRTSAEPGIVFGHENMGIIVEVGPGVASVKKGDRVVLPLMYLDRGVDRPAHRQRALSGQGLPRGRRPRPTG